MVLSRPGTRSLYRAGLLFPAILIVTLIVDRAGSQALLLISQMNSRSSLIDSFFTGSGFVSLIHASSHSLST